MSIGFDPGNGGGTGLPAADQGTLDWLNGLTVGQQQPQPDYGLTPQSGAEDYGNYDPYAGAPPTQGQGYSDYVDAGAQPNPYFNNTEPTFSSGVSEPDQTQPNFYLDQTPSLPDFSAGIRQQQDNAPVFQQGPWQGAANNTEPDFSSGVDTSGQNPDIGLTQSQNESPVNHWNPDTTPWVLDPDGVWRQHGPNDYRKTTAFQYSQNNLGEGLQASGGRPTTNARSLGTVYWDPLARGDYKPDEGDPMLAWWNGTRQEKWQSEYRTWAASQSVNPTPQGAAALNRLGLELFQWNKWLDDYEAGAQERAGHGYTSQDLADRRIKAEWFTDRLPIDQAVTDKRNALVSEWDRQVAALKNVNPYDQPEQYGVQGTQQYGGAYAPDYTRQTGAASAGETFDTLLAIVNRGYGFEAAVKQYGLTPAEAAQIGLAASITDPARLARTRQLWIDAHIGTQFDNPTPQYTNSWNISPRDVALGVTGLRTAADVIAPNQTPMQRIGQVGKAIERAFTGVGVATQFATTLADNVVYLVQQAATGQPVVDGNHPGPASAVSAKYLQTVDDIKTHFYNEFIASYYGPGGMLAYGGNATLDTPEKVATEAARFRQENPALDMALDQGIQIALGELGAIGGRIVAAGVRGYRAPIDIPAPVGVQRVPEPVARPEVGNARPETPGAPVRPDLAGEGDNIGGLPPVVAEPRPTGLADPAIPVAPSVDVPRPTPALDRPAVGDQSLPPAAVPEPVAPPARPTGRTAIEPPPVVSSVPDAGTIAPQVRTAFDEFLASPQARQDIYIPTPAYIARNTGATIPEVNALIDGALADGRLRQVGRGREQRVAFAPPPRQPAVNVPEPYNTRPSNTVTNRTPSNRPAPPEPSSRRAADYDWYTQQPEWEGASSAEIRAAVDRSIAQRYGKNAKYGEFRPDQLVDTPVDAPQAPLRNEPRPAVSSAPDALIEPSGALSPTDATQRAVVEEYRAALQRADPGEIKYYRDLASSEGVSDSWLAEVERNTAADIVAADPVARTARIQDRITEIDHSPEAVVFNYINANGQLRAVNPVTGKRLVRRSNGKFSGQVEEIWNLPNSGYDDVHARIQGYNPRTAESLDEFFPRAIAMWQERQRLKTELQALRREAGKIAPEAPPQPARKSATNVPAPYDTTSTVHSRLSPEAIAVLDDKAQQYDRLGLPRDPRPDGAGLGPPPPPGRNRTVNLDGYTSRLYREMSADDASYILQGQTPGDELYFSATPDLALGQGYSKGVRIEFRATGIKGVVNTSMPAWSVVWPQGEAEFVSRRLTGPTLRNNIVSIDVAPRAAQGGSVGGRGGLRIRLRRLVEDDGWTKTTLADGSVRYTPPEGLATGKPNTPVGQFPQERTLPGTPSREFGGPRFTDLTDSPYNTTAAPLKLEMQYGGLPDTEVARIKAQDAGQGNLFDTGAPKKGVTKRSVQNDPTLYSIGPAGARAIGGGIIGYATGDDDEDRWRHAALGAAIGAGLPGLKHALPVVDKQAAKLIYGPAAKERGAFDAFWHGVETSLPDLGGGRRGKGLIFAASRDAQRNIVADTMSWGIYSALDAELSAANITTLAGKVNKDAARDILKRLISDPASHDLTGVFDGTRGAQMRNFLKQRESAYLNSVFDVLADPPGGLALTPDIIAKRFNTITDELLAAPGEIGKTWNPKWTPGAINGAIVRFMAPLWMTLKPSFHLNNTFGNLAGEIASALANPGTFGQGGLFAGRKGRQAIEGRTRGGIKAPAPQATIGSGNRFSDYITADFTGGPDRRGGALERIPGVKQGMEKLHGASNAVEGSFKERIFNTKRAEYLGTRMRFEFGQDGPDLVPTLFTDHFGGMTPTLKGLPDTLRESLRGVLDANEAQRIVKASGIPPADAGRVMRTFRTALADAERFGDSETAWAMRNYRQRSNGDWIMDQVVGPLSFWTTHNILATARVAARNPAAIAPIAAAILWWREQNHDLPDSLKNTINLDYRAAMEWAGVDPQVQADVIGTVDAAFGQNAELRLRPWNWINPALDGAVKNLKPDEIKGHQQAASLPQLITGFMENFGYQPTALWDAVGTLARRLPEAAGYQPIIVAGLNNEDYFNPSVAGQWGTWSRALAAFMANNADSSLPQDNAARGVADLLREVPYKFNSVVYGDRYSQYEHEAIAKLIANQERLGKITHDQALNALKNGEKDGVFLSARQEFTDQSAGRGAVSYAGLPVTGRNDYQRQVAQANTDYFDPAKSKDDRKAFLTDKQWLTTDWAKDDTPQAIQSSQDVSAYFQLPSPKSGLSAEENKRRAAAQKAFIAAHPQMQKILDNAFAAKTLNIQDYELEVGGRKASDEYYALVDKYGYDDPRVKAFEQKNHDLLTAYKQRDMTADEVRDDNGTYVLMQTVGQYFDLPSPAKGVSQEENNKRAGAQEAFLRTHPEVRQYLNNIEGSRNDQGLVDTTAHKLQLQRQAEYFDFKAKGETGKAARALAQSPDIPSRYHGLWDDTDPEAVYQQQQNQKIMGDKNPSGRTPTEELAYKAAMDQLGPYPANGSDTAKELWIANAKKIGWHSDTPTDPVQQWFDTHPYPENGTSAEKSAWAVAARKAGWVPSDEDPMKRLGSGLLGGTRIVGGVPIKTTPDNDAPSTDPLKRWMNENPYPEKGTSAQKAAWVAEATKRGWKSTSGTTTTTTTAKPATGGGTTSTPAKAPTTTSGRTSSAPVSARPSTTTATTKPAATPARTPTLPASNPYATPTKQNRSPGNPTTGVPFLEGVSQWSEAQRNARPFVSSALAAASNSPASSGKAGNTAPATPTGSVPDKPFSASAYQYAVKQYTANPNTNSLNTIFGMLRKLDGQGKDITPYVWQVIRDLEKSIVPRIKAYQGPDRATGDRIRGQMLAAVKGITPDLDGLQLLMEIQGALS